MKKFSIYIVLGLFCMSAFLLEGCRGTIRTRTVRFGDHNVTSVKRHSHHKVNGGQRSVIRFKRH